MREIKRFAVRAFKSVDEQQGTAEFLVAVFGNVDRGNDVVEKGAFANVIANQTRLPKFVPNHDWDVTKRLGKVLSWREDNNGLVIGVQFNLEKQIAKDIYSDSKFDPEGQEFSFSFDIAEKGYTIKDNVRHIINVAEVYDVGPVGIGMNPETALIDVKSVDDLLAMISKEGRRDSGATREWLKSHKETLRQIEKSAGAAAKDIEGRLAEYDDEKNATGRSLDSEYLRLSLQRQAGMTPATRMQ